MHVAVIGNCQAVEGNAREIGNVGGVIGSGLDRESRALLADTEYNVISVYNEELSNDGVFTDLSLAIALVGNGHTVGQSALDLYRVCIAVIYYYLTLEADAVKSAGSLLNSKSCAELRRAFDNVVIVRCCKLSLYCVCSGVFLSVALVGNGYTLGKSADDLDGLLFAVIGHSLVREGDAIKRDLSLFDSESSRKISSLDIAAVVIKLCYYRILARSRLSVAFIGNGHTLGESAADRKALCLAVIGHGLIRHRDARKLGNNGGSIYLVYCDGSRHIADGKIILLIKCELGGNGVYADLDGTVALIGNGNALGESAADSYRMLFAVIVYSNILKGDACHSIGKACALDNESRREILTSDIGLAIVEFSYDCVSARIGFSVTLVGNADALGESAADSKALCLAVIGDSLTREGDTREIIFGSRGLARRECKYRCDKEKRYKYGSNYSFRHFKSSPFLLYFKSKQRKRNT